MKEWTIYLLRTTAEFFWFVLVWIAKALKWTGMNLWKLIKLIKFKKKKPVFSTSSESEKLMMDARKKRPEYIKRLQKVEADMGEHSAKYKVLSEEQQQLLQMISVADGGLDKPMSKPSGGNNNNNNNNQKQKGGNNNGGNKQPAISTFKPTLTS